MLAKVEKTQQQLVDQWVYEQTGGKVYLGPFAGMKLILDTAWKDTVLAPMLLGTYEQELHEDIEREIARLSAMPAPVVANVGCSEGYYAVGLAGRLPNAKVYAVDTDENCMILTTANAEMNRYPVHFTEDVDLLMNESDLIVMDCEGAEAQYLDIDRFPGLAKASIIVEIHNIAGLPHVGDTMVHRFDKTHTIMQIFEGPRNPNVFPFMLNVPSMARWMCVNENRPCWMDWFVMRPKDGLA